ncbi:hypothetical protein A6E13_18870 [Aliivibrio fischeri]|uniref:restriction endonuclease subunit S n=1 Tax=Aliivibrio fischeri TaxID=668 RepID=UPI00080E7FF2|nr:restriction endonuclease subunit S [Aliivibrio fischeri]OCH25794.1 hypothetical protein A6E12_02285 [Aliivibrio fischeri]OCH30698.1 hypothetical protein A6E13_18870 [Aliivibrio fischeri]
MSKVALNGKYAAYPEYKDSGVEWLGDIPTHWLTTAIKRVASFTTGMTPSTAITTYYSDDKTEFEWVRPEDIIETNQHVNASKFLTKSGWETQRVVPINSSLICCIGTIGKTGYSSKPVTTNQQITAATFSLSSKFYFYVLLAARIELEQMATGNVVQILNTERLSRLYVPLLQENDAQCIADFLDHETAKIDTLIEKQQKLIELLKEKRQAVISHAVTKGLNPDAPMKDSGVEWLGEVPEHWNILKMGYECEVTKLTGFEYTNHWKPDEQGEIIALRGFNIQERYLDLQKVEKITALLSCKLSRSKLHQGDIVLPCTGTLGNASVIESDGKYHINQNIAKLTFSRKVLPDFAVFWLTSEPFRRMIDFNNTSGMQPVLLIGDIRNMRLPLPPLKEQQEIASYLKDKLSRFDKLIKKATSAINLIQERRTALISAAVTGKIDVRHFTLEDGVAPTTSSDANEAQQEVTA